MSNPNPSKLSFTFIANACGIFTGSQGSTVLCDPWLDDGVFEGSWCHYPKLKTTMRDVQNVDAIYVSHLHPDHFDDRFFEFDKSKPLIVLDHGPNFLIKNLIKLGYENLIRIKDGQTVDFKEFKITLYAPFAKHNFHDAAVGNLIDSALLIECDGLKALNANDNTPTVESCTMLKEKFGKIDLAMINYNAAGPYPSCFDHLTKTEKVAESNRILKRNFEYMRDLILELKPRAILPFAGAYVLGGSLHDKNDCLGTTTWDECARYLSTQNINPTLITLLRENDTLNLETMCSDHEYVPINVGDMKRYITETLSKLKYPYQEDNQPDQTKLFQDMQTAAIGMKSRMERFKISSTFDVWIKAFGQNIKVYPFFEQNPQATTRTPLLKCSMDERLLRRILDKKSHWNNAEIGAHISFIRQPNEYEPDLHTGLQFFHL